MYHSTIADLAELLSACDTVTNIVFENVQKNGAIQMFVPPAFTPCREMLSVDFTTLGLNFNDVGSVLIHAFSNRHLPYYDRHLIVTINDLQSFPSLTEVYSVLRRRSAALNSRSLFFSEVFRTALAHVLPGTKVEDISTTENYTIWSAPKFASAINDQLDGTGLTLSEEDIIAHTSLEQLEFLLKLYGVLRNTLADQSARASRWHFGLDDPWHDFGLSSEIVAEVVTSFYNRLFPTRTPITVTPQEVESHPTVRKLIGLMQIHEMIYKMILKTTIFCHPKNIISYCKIDIIINPIH